MIPPLVTKMTRTDGARAERKRRRVAIILLAIALLSTSLYLVDAASRRRFAKVQAGLASVEDKLDTDTRDAKSQGVQWTRREQGIALTIRAFDEENSSNGILRLHSARRLIGRPTVCVYCDPDGIDNSICTSFNDGIEALGVNADLRWVENHNTSTPFCSDARASALLIGIAEVAMPIAELAFALFGISYLQAGYKGTLIDAKKVCGRCGYNLRGSLGERCSECGADILNHEQVQLVWHRNWRLLLIGCAALAVAVCLYYIG